MWISYIWTEPAAPDWQEIWRFQRGWRGSHCGGGWTYDVTLERSFGSAGIWRLYPWAEPGTGDSSSSLWNAQTQWGRAVMCSKTITFCSQAGEEVIICKYATWRRSWAGLRDFKYGCCSKKALNSHSKTMRQMVQDINSEILWVSRLLQ